MMDERDRPVPGPQVEIPMHRRARRQILGDRPPLAASREHIEQPAQHLAQINRALVAAAFAWRNQRRDDRPLRIG